MLCWLPCRLHERGSVPITVQEIFLLSISSLLVVTPAPNSAGTCGPFCVELSVGRWSYRHISIYCLRREYVEVYLYCTVMKYGIYFIVSLRPSGLHQFQAVILEDCPLAPAVITPIKPRGKFMYLNFSYSNISWEESSELLFLQPFLKSWIREMNKRCLINLEGYTVWRCGVQKEIFIEKYKFLYIFLFWINTL